MLWGFRGKRAASLLRQLFCTAQPIMPKWWMGPAWTSGEVGLPLRKARARESASQSLVQQTHGLTTDFQTGARARGLRPFVRVQAREHCADSRRERKGPLLFLGRAEETRDTLPKSINVRAQKAWRQRNFVRFCALRRARERMSACCLAEWLRTSLALEVVSEDTLWSAAKARIVEGLADSVSMYLCIFSISFLVRGSVHHTCYLPVYRAIYLSIHLSIYRCTCLCTYLCICLSVCLSVCLFVCQCLCISLS